MILDREENNIVVNHCQHPLKGWRSDQILTSDLFFLDTTRDIESEHQLNEYVALLSILVPNDTEKMKISKLQMQLKGIIPNPEETKVDRKIYGFLQTQMQKYIRELPKDEREEFQRKIKLYLSQEE